uniref:Uncharacterized protein n=1 Tax=Arundo donax TaxID=35708 RepID=A0A0A9GM74_ARUDO
MRNLDAARKMWRDALRLKDEVNNLGGKKEAGCNFVETGSTVWEFLCGDRDHPEYEVMCGIVRCLELHMRALIEKEFIFSGLVT